MRDVSRDRREPAAELWRIHEADVKQWDTVIRASGFKPDD